MKNDSGISEYLKRRISAPKKRIPEFKYGYVVVSSDNHVLDNKIFDNYNDAVMAKTEYDGQMPSFVENDYRIVKVSSGCLEYGAFPYEEQIYLIYELEQ